MPVRKIPKNYRNVTGVSPHRKAVGEAQYESTLERDFLTLLEFDPNVESFEVQPVTIEWKGANRKKRRYTPDALVHYKHGIAEPILYEVKYRKELKKKWPELRPVFKAAIHYTKEHGWRFKLITDTEIRTTYLSNARFLLPFVRRGPQSEEHMEMLADKLQEQHQSTPGQLLKSIFQDEWHQAELLPTLWYLIGTRQIFVDMNQPLTMTSVIRAVKA